MGGAATAKEGERQGDFLGGKYLLEDCLGIGGMGEVYRATNVSLGRKVAIKLLNKEHTSNEDDVMRFLREARAAAAVRHPNVVDVFDVARDDDGTPFIVQELLSGQDLEQYLGASGGRLSPAEALEIMIPVADAVAAAHTRDVVHRDLKPANIFLAREGNRIIPKVLDFGACLYQTVGALSAKERRMLIGTPHYMAPEQISTAMDVDVRADVWAMGVILYELLVGETPFEAEDANAVMKLVRTRQVLPLRRKVPDASQLLEELVTQCLDRDRKKRFANAAAVRDELEAVRADLRGVSRRRLDTPSELEAQKVDLREGLVDESRVRDRRQAEAAKEGEVPSQRVPSLVLKGGKVPTKRRGSSLLTLSSPDEKVSWEADPPTSASRPINAAKPSSSLSDSQSFSRPGGPKPARTAADVIRDAEAASSPAGGAPASQQPPTSQKPPTSRPKEHGAPRDLDLDDLDEPHLDLELDGATSRRAAEVRNSSIPPVLDPRAASSALSSTLSSASSPLRQNRSEPPPAPKPLTDSGLEKLRSSQSTTRETSLTPPLTPPLRSPRTPSSAHIAEAPLVWTGRAKATFAAGIVVPALVAFAALRFAPMVLAPLGHAMRGDSPLASGVLAVLTLVGAAALAARALGASRSPGTLLATVGAVLLGILMIIVTFSASETAELGIPPAAGGIVPFIAPIVPLGLGVVAFGKARAAWLSRYDRGDAVKLVALTSFLLLALLELGPLGAIRAATAAPAPSTTTKVAPARPAP